MPATAATTSSTSATTTGTIAHSNDERLALSSGALPVISAKPVDANGEVWHMFDEDATTGWCSTDGNWKQPTGRVPKQLTVEVSDRSATDGFNADHADFLYLTQNGTAVTGCYSHGLAPLAGGMEGRLLKYSDQMPDNDSGLAIAIFSNDGSVFEGRWKTTGVAAEHPRLTPAAYKKTGDKPGQCPNEKKLEDQLASDLKQKGRVRLFGINFDSDSATIRDESKPALDIVAAMLKANPDLAAGFGATKPVATNDNALGRAENRRFELAKS